MAGTVLIGSGWVKATLVCLDNDQVSLNSFVFFVAPTPTPTLTDADLAQYLDANLYGTIKPILNSNAMYRGWIAQIVSVSGAALYVSRTSNVNAGAGTSGTEALPRQTCGITSWYTALPGRNNRGRTYWPFPSTEDDQGNGLPTTAYVNNIDALAAAIQAISSVTESGRTATIGLTIKHRKSGGSTLVTARTTRSVWATQRRRGSYGRQNAPPI